MPKEFGVGQAKDITLNARAAVLSRLRTHFKVGEKDMSFLKDTSKVIEYMENRVVRGGGKPSINTLKGEFSHIVAALRDSGGKTKVFTATIAKYRERMLSYRDKHDEIAKTQTASPSELKKWNEWETIIKVRESLAKEATTFSDFQKYLIVCLYTFIEPQRLDYSPMKWVSEAPVYTDNERHYNVCLMTATKATFIFHEYKSEATYGTRQIEAPPDLFKVLQAWKKFNKTNWLLLKLDRETPLPETALGQKIGDIFEAETGKASTVNTLRHAYITHIRKCEISLTDKEKMALNMAHSASTNEKYRRLPSK